MSKHYFLKGATIGAILASVATLLMAPKSGKKTRSDVQKLVTVLSKRMSKQLETLSDISKDAYDELVTTAVKEYTRGKKVSKDFVQDVTGVLKQNWKEVQKELKKK